MDDGAITADRRQILDLATKHRLPVVSIYKDFAKSGGLIAYGPNLDIVYRRAAHFVDKLIKGGQAGALPIEQPVIFDLVINQRTARTLGITIPQDVLSPRRRGDRIEICRPTLRMSPRARLGPSAIPQSRFRKS